MVLWFSITQWGVGKKECQIREKICGLYKFTPLFWYIGVKILRQHCYQLMCSVCHYFVYVFHLIKFVCLFFFSFLLLQDFYWWIKIFIYLLTFHFSFFIRHPFIMRRTKIITENFRWHDTVAPLQYGGPGSSPMENSWNFKLNCSHWCILGGWR